MISNKEMNVTITYAKKRYSVLLINKEIIMKKLSKASQKNRRKFKRSLNINKSTFQERD